MVTDAATAAGRSIERAQRVSGARIGPDWRNAGFVLPFLVVYLLLLVWPLFDGIWISLQKFDMFDGTGAYAGLVNYKRLFADKVFLGAVWNTALFVLMTVPAFVAIGLALALALNRPGRTAAVLRATFFATSVLSVTIVTIIWKMMYLTDRGLLTNVLAAFGQAPIPILSDPDLALPGIAVATVWWGIGLPMMLFLAALQQIPRELYEAAALDSAGRWRSFRHITLPSIRRTVVLVAVVEIVYQFQLFGQSYLLTRGGPNNATRPIVQFIYEQGFRNWDLGYAAAASEVLFGLMLIAAMAQYLLTRRRSEG
ncbi:sugar ABC transporter permease [Inquilinus limosus]